MYYKKLFFQEHRIRFIDDKVVIDDVYSFFGRENKFYDLKESKRIEAVDISNGLECIKDSDDLILDVISTKGLKEILIYLKRDNCAIDIFKNWFFNYALLYVKDINYLYMQINDLNRVNYDLIDKLNNLQYKDTVNTKTIVKLREDIIELKEIVLNSVGLSNISEDKTNSKIELKAAFEDLQKKFGASTNKRIAKAYLSNYHINISLRASNRNLSLLDYLLTEETLAENALNLINNLTK